MPGVTHYGWAETTPALRGILARGAGMLRTTGRRRRRKAKGAKRASGSKKKSRTRVAKGMAHLVKGSPAAKKRMAQLRKLAKKARKG